MTLQVTRWQCSTCGLVTPSGGPYDAAVIGGCACRHYIELALLLQDLVDMRVS